MMSRGYFNPLDLQNSVGRDSNPVAIKAVDGAPTRFTGVDFGVDVAQRGIDTVLFTVDRYAELDDCRVQFCTEYLGQRDASNRMKPIADVLNNFGHTKIIVLA